MFDDSEESNLFLPRYDYINLGDKGQSIILASEQFGRLYEFSSLKDISNRISFFSTMMGFDGGLRRRKDVIVTFSDDIFGKKNTLKLLSVKKTKIQEYLCIDLMFESESPNRTIESIDFTNFDNRFILAVLRGNQTTLFEIDDYYVIQLYSKEKERQIEALNNLGERRYYKGIPDVAQLISSENLEVALEATQCLENIGHPDSLPFLIKILGSTDSVELEERILETLETFQTQR